VPGPAPRRSPAPGPTSERGKAIRHPWRVAIVAIGLVAVLNLAVIVLASSETSTPDAESLTVTVEAISPGRGELTTLVDDVTVDLRNDLTGALVIDGIEIPEDQVDAVVDLGILTFRPGPDQELTKLRSGDNTVVVRCWPRTRDRPADPPTCYSWRFRAAA